LLTYHPKTLAPLPGLAKSWDISPDGLVYTFHLRDSSWSDGLTITAQTFVESWVRLLSPKTGASYASLLYPVIHAEKFHQGQIQDAAKVGLKSLNTQTLQVTLHTPCSYFLDLCAFVSLYPVPLHVIQQHGDAWIQPENLVSNGAFALKSWQRRQHLIFEPNPRYHDRDAVHLNRIEAKLVDDNDTAYKLFLQGELDWITTIPLPKQDEATWHPDYYAMPFMGCYFYRFNVTKPPFNDPKVRRAFSMSVNRRVITGQILKGGEQAASFFCPPVGGYEHIKGLDYDPRLAKQLLKEAGYNQQNPFPHVEVFFNTSENHKKIAEAISQMWQENLGVRVQLRNSEWKVFLNEMNELNYDICRSSWIGDYGDPNTFFDLFQSKGGNNRTGWASDQYDGLLKKASLELNPKKRMGYFREMERLLVLDECPIMPIYIYINKGMIAPKVVGWFENVRDIHPMKSIWIKKP
jgi:oligopeptide transport system substrate-binding protein